MPMISVKTREGRVAFDAPSGGNRIPNDRYVSVEHTRWTERLLNVHRDIELEPTPAPAKKAAPAPAPTPAPAPAA